VHISTWPFFLSPGNKIRPQRVRYESRMSGVCRHCDTHQRGKKKFGHACPCNTTSTLSLSSIPPPKPRAHGATMATSLVRPLPLRLMVSWFCLWTNLVCWVHSWNWSKMDKSRFEHDSSFGEEEKKQSKALKISCKLNNVACKLKRNSAQRYCIRSTKNYGLSLCNVLLICKHWNWLRALHPSSRTLEHRY